MMERGEVVRWDGKGSMSIPWTENARSCVLASLRAFGASDPWGGLKEKGGHF